jgi:hypothetical protein
VREELRKPQDAEASRAASPLPRGSNDDDADGDDEEMFLPDITTTVIPASPVRERRRKRQRKHQRGQSRRSHDDNEISSSDLTTMAIKGSSNHEQRRRRRPKRERGNSRHGHRACTTPITSLRENVREEPMEPQYLEENTNSMNASPYSVKSASKLKISGRRERLKESLRMIGFQGQGGEERHLDHAGQRQFHGSTESSQFQSPLDERIIHRSGRYPSPVSQFFDCSSNDLVLRHDDAHASTAHSRQIPALDGYNNPSTYTANGNVNHRDLYQRGVRGLSAAAQSHPQNFLEAGNKQIPWLSPPNHMAFAQNSTMNYPAYEYQQKHLPEQKGHFDAQNMRSGDYYSHSNNLGLTYPDLQNQTHQRISPNTAFPLSRNGNSSRGMNTEQYKGPQISTAYTPTSVLGFSSNSYPECLREPNLDYKPQASNSIVRHGEGLQSRTTPTEPSQFPVSQDRYTFGRATNSHLWQQPASALPSYNPTNIMSHPPM